jgi:hypothetical protein
MKRIIDNEKATDWLLHVYKNTIRVVTDYTPEKFCG